MIYLEYIIETGLIINAIVYDGESEYATNDGAGLVERADSGAWIGWLYIEGEFIPPIETEVE